jgi:hypothetical protein
MTDAIREFNHHDYATDLLGWAVIEPINGGTDWYTTAAFDSESDAREYADRLNQAEPTRALPFEVQDIGSHWSAARG